MGWFRFLLVICALLPSFLLKGEQQRDPVLSRIITLHAGHLSAADILKQITRENHIFFSYDASLLHTPDTFTLHLVNTPVSEILDTILGKGKFFYQEKENHIIIYSGNETAGPGQEAEVLSTMITLTGKVIDEVFGMPLRDVNISLYGRAIGTITNAQGEFILKIPPGLEADTLVFSILGYGRHLLPVKGMTVNEVIRLHPVSIRIREVKVRAVPVSEVLSGIRDSLESNYSASFQLLTGFYRETLRQDDAYINVSEAVVEILKAPYSQDIREDRVRLLKARRSPEVHPFHWVNFKLQGGPHTITLLDVIGNMETFLDPGYELLYRYSIDRVIWYKNHPAFVIRFRPARNIDMPCFSGELYVDRESYALLFARFSLDPYGLNIAEQSMIKKKPKGFKVKPQFVDYEVDYAEHEGKWHLHKATASIAFRVRNPRENVNSLFHSVSALLVTDVAPTDLKRFPVKDLFTINDIFSETDFLYDESFWGHYNIIKPDEDLTHAIRQILPVQGQ